MTYPVDEPPRDPLAIECRCRNCGSTNDRWITHCPACGAAGKLMPAHARRPLPRGSRRDIPTYQARSPVALGVYDAPKVERVLTGIGPLDKVFGGGLPKPFAILLAGPPGIGKSTLMTQVAGALGRRALYITTEESLGRLSTRALRVLGRDKARQVWGLSTLDAQVGARYLARLIRNDTADVIVLDSLQGVRMDHERISGEGPREWSRGGALETRRHSQHVTRDIAMKLLEAINASKKTLIAMSHMNKAGDFVGLREIEHMLDCMAWFTGTPPSNLRELRCSKNREGDTSLVAQFEMLDSGLKPLGVSRGSAEDAKKALARFGLDDEDDFREIARPRRGQPKRWYDED